MISSVVDETVKCGDCPKQIAALIDDDGSVFTAIVRKLNGNVNTGSVTLNNRYYTADVALRVFTLKELSDWRNTTTAVCAIIAKYTNTLDFELLQNSLRDYRCDVIVVVVHDDAQMDRLQHEDICGSSLFEFVVMYPSEQMIKEASDSREKCGIDRLVEILNTSEWPYKSSQVNKTTGKEGVDRILALLEGMSDSEDADLSPDEDDKEAIWHAFASNMPFTVNGSTVASSSQHDEDQSVEASVSVDITLSNTSKEKDVAYLNSVSLDKSNKKKKKRKGKSNAPSAVDDIMDTNGQFKSREELAVFDKLIESVENGTPDLAIGEITKVRERLAKLPFNDKSRLDKAEAIVRGFAEAWGNGDGSDSE